MALLFFVHAFHNTFLENGKTSCDATETQRGVIDISKREERCLGRWIEILEKEKKMRFGNKKFVMEILKD